MPRALDSIEAFEQLWSSVRPHEFSLFLGAGISKDPPTNGPIWSEMQTGFLSAVFSRMEAETWPIASSFPEDRQTVRDLNVRPETFWRLLLDSCGQEVVWSGLQAADVGLPNKNHLNIAALLAARRCKLAVTTNFDEHVERLLSPEVHVKVVAGEPRWALVDAPTYLKLHGTVSNGPSLSYTLEQYDGLRDRHLKLIDALSGRPLIVAGYSGYDTDVLPALGMSVGNVPFVVVVKHPGSPPAQPILRLGEGHDNVYVLEARCSDVLDLLAKRLDVSVSGRTVPATRTSDVIYRGAAKLLEMPYCPVALMHLFSLGGHWQDVRRYGWLAHDACLDARYRPRLADKEFRGIHTTISYALKLAGDDSGSRIMLSEARNSLDETGGTASEAIMIQGAAALASGAPDRLNQSQQPPTSSESSHRPSDVLSVGLKWATMLKGTDSDPRDTFLRWWQIGIARRREGDSPGAIDAFNECAGLLLKQEGFLTRLEDGHFLLDYGGALLDEAQKTRSTEFLQKADVLYKMCEKATREVGDWATNARALLMMANICFWSDLLDEARQNANAAMDSANKTGDSALGHRIQVFLDKLK
jgi:hypothetical protein